MSSQQDIWKAAVLAVGLVAISPVGSPASVGAPIGPSAAQASDALVTLDQSTAPLEQYFNQAGDQIRFLALLSPT
jgi:hypothetical protein